jgi:amino acid transporter
MIDEPLIRRLTVFGIWLLVVNGMIGAGIFGVGAEAARLTGAFSPWMFLLCGVLMAPVMLSFSEVARYFEGTGGPILYAHTAFGPLAAFQTGWAFYIARATAFAANLNLLISGLAFFWTGADQGWLRLVLLTSICGALTWVNVIGSGEAMRTVGVLTILKFVPLIALVVLGLPVVGIEIFAAPAAQVPVAGDFGAALVLLVYAYVGFESALVPAGEARDPRRDMGRALLLSLVVVSLLYFLIQAVCVSVLPALATTERPLVEAGAVLLGSTGALIMTAGVIASVAGNVAGAMFSTPRMTYALALEGQLPSVFATVHPVHRTPSVSVIVFGALVLALALTGSFAWLAGISVVTRLLIYLVCIGAIPRLRRWHANQPGTTNVARGWAIPLISAVICVGLLSQVSARSALVTAAFLGVGVALFALNAWYQHRRLSH